MADDQPLVYIRRDISGGVNTRQAGTHIEQNQVTNLINGDIGTAGEVTKRPGNDSIATLSSSAVSLTPFQPIGGTNQLVAMYSTKLATSTGGAFTDRKTDFTATSLPTTVQGGKAANTTLGTFTVTIASPGVFTKTTHGLTAGTAIYFTTTGALPTGLTANTAYYVISAGLTADNFQVSTTAGGSAVNTSGSQSGTHSVYKHSGYSSGDVLFVGNGTDNWFQMAQDYVFSDLGNVNTSPPRSNVGSYYRSRFWVLSNNKLFWSDAFDDDYGGAFNRTTNYYNMPVGQEKALIGLRQEGLLCFGSDRVYGINPSGVPDATDQPELLYERGCVAGRTVVQAGDDVYFMSQDGIRALFRSQQDKLQIGSTNPISWNIKDQWNSLSWAYVEKACAVYFDNKIFFSVPVDASTTNNQVWVYYPATKGWMIIDGWNISSFAKVTLSGQEKLFGTDAATGKVYQLWTANDDDGTAIAYTEEGRKDDMGNPLITKTGGYLRVRVYSAGSYTIPVYASIDDQGYIKLGDIVTPGSGTGLPLTLPFTMTNPGVTEATFPLDDLGSWKYIQTKIEHDAINTDEIKILERNLLTYGDEYLP
jgi:hypothetical protein